MGDIKLASVDGYGTDTYIYLQVQIYCLNNVSDFGTFVADIKHGCGEFTCFQLCLERQAHEHCNTG